MNPIKVDLPVIFAVGTAMKLSAEKSARGANRGIDMMRNLASFGVSVVVDDPEKLLKMVEATDDEEEPADAPLLATAAD